MLDICRSDHYKRLKVQKLSYLNTKNPGVFWFWARQVFKSTNSLGFVGRGGVEIMDDNHKITRVIRWKFLHSSASHNA